MPNQRLNIIQFQADLKKFSDRVHRDLVETTVDLAVAAYGEIVGETPRDTGTARANWNLSVGAPDLSISEKKVYEQYASPTSKDEAGEFARERAESELGPLREQSASNLQTIYITNALPYIAPLNNGTSQQAPAGFVETAVQKVELLVVEDRIRQRIK